MNTQEKFNETSLPEKEGFYSQLKMEDITDADYTQAKRVCKYFEIKDLGEYQDVCAQSNKLVLADIFEIFWNMCFQIYELDPALFFTAPGISMASSHRND